MRIIKNFAVSFCDTSIRKVRSIPTSTIFICLLNACNRFFNMLQLPCWPVFEHARCYSDGYLSTALRGFKWGWAATGVCATTPCICWSWCWHYILKQFWRDTVDTIFACLLNARVTGSSTCFNCPAGQFLSTQGVMKIIMCQSSVLCFGNRRNYTCLQARQRAWLVLLSSTRVCQVRVLTLQEKSPLVDFHDTCTV